MWCYYMFGMKMVLFGFSLVVCVFVRVLWKWGWCVKFGCLKFIMLIIWFFGVGFSGLGYRFLI